VSVGTLRFAHPTNLPAVIASEAKLLAMTAEPEFEKDITMASIHKEIIIDASPADVWDALRDFGALHTRLVPGFVTDTKLDGDARIVTFANGTVARETLVDSDEERKRLVYAINSDRVKHYSASA